MIKRNCVAAAVLAAAIFLCSQALAQGVSLTGVKNVSDVNEVKALLELSGPAAPPKIFTLSDPARIVADFKAIDVWQAPYEEAAGDDDLKHIRVGRPETDTVRVVIELNYLLPYNIEPFEGGPSLLIRIPRKVATASESKKFPGGISYKRVSEMRSFGPITYHVMDVNLSDPKVSVGVVSGEDRIGAREALSSMAERKGAAAAINGGYFQMEDGKPIDFLVIGGKVLTLPERYRGFFGLTRARKPVFLQPRVEMTLSVNGGHPWSVHRLNMPPKEEQVAVFTPEFGATTGTSPERREAAVVGGKVVSISDGGGAIPPDGFVVSGDSMNLLFDVLETGDTVVRSVTSYPDISDVADGVTAGPLLIRNGIVQNSLTEDFNITSVIVAKRNPRTAVGRAKNNHLLFVVVEGRSVRSAGMLIGELAELMKSLGSVDAINLDGGGSSEMIIGDKIMNDLSDGKERPLANAFMIYHADLRIK
jgi:exopolysaccharide biosynthesis protein